MNAKSQNSTIYSLIMAGGSGTRFWPESTSKRPKQYLSLVSDRPLLADTLDRFDGLVDKNHRFIVTVESQSELARECSSGSIHEKGIILEPSGRNTAPCILLSVAEIVRSGGSEKDIVVVVPSDHVILNRQGFQETVQLAAKRAYESDEIVTIGIPPNFPHTGFGYIEKSSNEVESGVYKVESFKEKPSFDVAKDYIASGNYLWNAGMFVAKLGVFLKEFSTCAPEIHTFYQDLLDNLDSSSQIAEIYERIPKNSIDYAVMEKTKSISVVPANFDWNDLGSWDALESVLEKDGENTVVKTKGHHFNNAKGNIVYAPDQFVALANIDDHVIVSSDKSLLVLPKSDAQEVKNIVEELQRKERRDLL